LTQSLGHFFIFLLKSLLLFEVSFILLGEALQVHLLLPHVPPELDRQYQLVLLALILAATPSSRTIREVSHPRLIAVGSFSFDIIHRFAWRF